MLVSKISLRLAWELDEIKALKSHLKRRKCFGHSKPTLWLTAGLFNKSFEYTFVSLKMKSGIPKYVINY